MAGKGKRVSKAAAEEAVRTLLRWAGEDPKREGLLETPRRVVLVTEFPMTSTGKVQRNVLRARVMAGS